MTDRYHCAHCREPLGFGSPPSGIQRIPCPRCGSTSVAVEGLCRDVLTLADHHSALVARLGRIIAFSESKRFDGRSAFGGANADGTLDFGAHGPPPQNANHALTVCRSLVDHLNKQGEQWAAPVEVRPEEVPGVDCVCVGSSDSGARLHLQVVRAVIETSLYKSWG